MAFLLAFHRHAACLAQCKLGHWASEWGKRSAQHGLRIYDLIDCFYGKNAQLVLRAPISARPLALPIQ
jgi:hypothetical protein